MSPSLSFDCEFLSEPGVLDPLDRVSWSILRVLADGRQVSRIRDRASGAERTGLFVPAFPVVAWIVENWWTLLYEPARVDELRPPGSHAHQPMAFSSWWHRHCLRGAAPGVLLPRLLLHGDGDQVRIDWFADDSDAFPHLPGYFLSGGSAWTDRGQVEDSLRELVTQVLEQAKTIADPRIDRVQENWLAIRQADPSEAAFCRATARVGLDPYDDRSWPSGLAELLERELSDGEDSPAIIDLLDAAAAERVTSLWPWVSEAQRALHPSGREVVPEGVELPGHRPVALGYGRARWLRDRLGLSIESPIFEVESVTEGLGLSRLQVESKELPSDGVSAAAGWVGEDRPGLLAARVGRIETYRFLLARGAYQALFACQRGPRLITRAHTSEQQASRAFAAELLAPQDTLVTQFFADAASGDVAHRLDAIAARFQVSPRLVGHQLENAGVDLSEE